MTGHERIEIMPGQEIFVLRSKKFAHYSPRFPSCQFGALFAINAVPCLLAKPQRPQPRIPQQADASDRILESNRERLQKGPTLQQLLDKALEKPCPKPHSEKRQSS